MKRLIIIIFSVFGLTINSCKKEKEKEPSNQGVTAEKKDVKTYEIINLIFYGNFTDKYNATFGSANIELIKTSDTTLSFYVPDIAEGVATLKFELAWLKFNVTKTKVVTADQLVSTLVENFDAKISLLNPSTPGEIAEVDSLKKFKQEVVSLFNSLPNDEKRQASLFYEANKEVFKSFSNSTFLNLDATTTMRRQSECPKTNFKTFYGCTATNLGIAAVGLKNASKEFLKMLFLAGASAYLAPASFGLSAIGTTLALGTAGYLLLTEVRPAALHFKHSLIPFLKANWIFTIAFGSTIAQVFQDEVSTRLNFNPKFRSINSNDRDLNSGTAYFIYAMDQLYGYWDKLASIFGRFPSYQKTEKAADLTTNEISISNITNPNVQYSGNEGQNVKFKSLSGNEETFSYNIKVTKEGFFEEKTLSGKVVDRDSTEIYKNSAIGKYKVNGPPNPGNGPNSKLFCELKTGGVAEYTIYDDGAWPNGHIFYENWTVRKSNNRYIITTSFTNPGHLISQARPITYPVTGFIYMHTYVK